MSAKAFLCAAISQNAASLALCQRLAQTTDNAAHIRVDHQTGQPRIPAHNSGFTVEHVLGAPFDSLSLGQIQDYQTRTGNLVNPFTEQGDIIYTEQLPVDYGRTGSLLAHPQAGDIIYVPTQGSFSHGHDDTAGGWATVQSVYEQMSGGNLAAFIRCEFYSSRAYNWESLRPRQDPLRLSFGKIAARLDPDYNDYGDAAEWR